MFGQKNWTIKCPTFNVCENGDSCFYFQKMTINNNNMKLWRCSPNRNLENTTKGLLQSYHS